MPVYTNPGVFVNEGPFATTVNTSTDVAAAAFIGTAERGPTSPLFIQSWNGYKLQFGDLNANHDLGYAVYHFFANGGRTAYVHRAISSSASAGFANIPGNANNAASASLFRIGATNAGAWGNNLKVTITAGNVAAPTPTYNFTVLYNNVEVEQWSEISLNKNDNRYIESVLNVYSSYVYAYNVNPSTAGASYSVNSGTITFTGGSDGAAVGDADWNTAIRKLDGVEGELLINLVGQSSSNIINNAINYVDPEAAALNAVTYRKNSFLLVDPSPAQITRSMITTFVSAYTPSSYAAVYYGMLQMANPAVRGSAALRVTYPGGAVAGLYQRVAAERGIGRAPAGYSYVLQNAYAVVTSFTEAQVGELYSPSTGPNVNTFKNVPGAGVIVNGARTMKRTDITKYIPARRTLNYIKATAETLTRPALFEPIGPRLWNDLSARLSKMLADLWASGALKGKNTSEAFYIVCDETNNPVNVSEGGEVRVEIGVALQTPAEFIVINVSQFTGGSTVTETF